MARAAPESAVGRHAQPGQPTVPRTGRCNRHLLLQLAGNAPKHADSRCRYLRDQGTNQRGLADARLALDQRDRNVARLGPLEHRLENRAFLRTTDEPGHPSTTMTSL